MSQIRLVKDEEGKLVLEYTKGEVTAESTFEATMSDEVIDDLNADIEGKEFTKELFYNLEDWKKGLLIYLIGIAGFDKYYPFLNDYDDTDKSEEDTDEYYDNVTKPRHYMGRLGLEALEVHRNFLTAEELKGYFVGNTLKYVLRYKDKNGLEDLKKARMHLNWLIEVLEDE